MASRAYRKPVTDNHIARIKTQLCFTTDARTVKLHTGPTALQPARRVFSFAGLDTMRKVSQGKDGDGGESRPSLNTRLFWSIIAVFVVVDAIGMELEDISAAPAPLWDMVWRTAALLGLSLFYMYFRPDFRIATLTHAVAMFGATATPIAIFYYLATAWQHPFVDAQLAAADHALGLNWVATYKWVAALPPLQMILSMAYYSLLPQAVVLILALNFLGEIGRAWELPWLLLVSSIILIPFSIFSPALGPFAYFHINESTPYLQIITDLHSGTFRTLDFHTMQGVVTFPSFHAASAIMLAYAARGTRMLFPGFVLINSLMFLATPTLGGHFFVDVWGGTALAVVTILIVRKYCSSVISPAAISAP